MNMGPKKRLPFPWHPSVKKKLEMAVVEQLFTQGAAGEYSVHTRSCWGIQCSHKELLGNAVFTQRAADDHVIGMEINHLSGLTRQIIWSYLTVRMKTCRKTHQNYCTHEYAFIPTCNGITNRV